MNVIWNVRNGVDAGTNVRIAHSANAPCKPPNALRPCSQSSVTVDRTRPGSACIACMSSVSVIRNLAERRIAERAC